MYKNTYIKDSFASVLEVSILVLMELCIKTIHAMISKMKQEVSILVLMELCIKTEVIDLSDYVSVGVSILVLMELCIKTI